MPEIAVHSLPVEPTVVAALRAIAAAGTPLSTDHAARGDARFLPQLCAAQHAAIPHAVCASLEDRAPLVIHCTAGKDRTGFACALILHTLGVSDDMIAEDYLLTNRFYRRDPNASSDLPDEVRQVLGTVQASFLAAAFEAIDADYGDLETYLRDGLGLGAAERADSKRAICSADLLATRLQTATDLAAVRRRRLGRRFHFHFGIEIGDDVLERRDRLLDRCDLHQFPARDRTAAILQRYDQVAPLLLKLNKR